jgi:hypothetical protein
MTLAWSAPAHPKPLTTHWLAARRSLVISATFGLAAVAASLWSMRGWPGAAGFLLIEIEVVAFAYVWASFYLRGGASVGAGEDLDALVLWPWTALLLPLFLFSQQAGLALWLLWGSASTALAAGSVAVACSFVSSGILVPGMVRARKRREWAPTAA